MNYLDYIIVYLACGSPFATYYFFDHRQTRKFVWVESFLILVLWIPFAFKLLHFKVTKFLKDGSEKIKFQRLNKLTKEFEDGLPENNLKLTLFEMREVIERYSELSLIKSELKRKPAIQENELYRITGNKNVEISSNCLNRRNRKRLLFHQTEARGDFLRVLEILSEFATDTKNLSKTALEFVKLITDEDCRILIENLMQTDGKPYVRDVEKEELLWKPIKQKPSNAQPNLIPMPALTATINPPKKD